MKLSLTAFIIPAFTGAAAEPPVWRPISLPAAARGLIERQESGPYVLSDSQWFNSCPGVLRAPDGKYHRAGKSGAGENWGRVRLFLERHPSQRALLWRMA